MRDSRSANINVRKEHHLLLTKNTVHLLSKQKNCFTSKALVQPCQVFGRDIGYEIWVRPASTDSNLPNVAPSRSTHQTVHL